MACSSGRVALPVVAQQQMFAEAAGFCQRCGTYLFLGSGSGLLTFAELAHVVAISPLGPRGNAPLTRDQRNDPQNIVLLCPTCHTIVDKAPQEFPPELLLQWKRDRSAMLQRMIGVERYRTRADALGAIEPILQTSRRVFEDYGPDSASYLDDEAAAAWHRKVLEVLLPGHHRLLATFDVNRDLLTKPEQVTVEEFRQHVDDLEARHVHGRIETGGRRFPLGTASIFRDE